jgi:hypothetical protein
MPLRRPPLACCLALAAIPLGSCQPEEIDVSLRQVEGRWIATLSQGKSLFSRGRTPCVEFVELTPEDSETGLVNTTAIWSISTKDLGCVDLATLTIGTTPASFTQQTPLPANIHGRYRLSVRGIGWGSATLTL